MTDTTAAKPLAQIRILEFGGYIAGPYVSSILCGLGAEVVKVEKPGTGDDFRRGDGARSPYFVQYNAGKRSIAVDLKRAEGVEFVKRLVPHYDVVLENMRPGKMEALGLGPDELRALRPDLVYASVTGFGSGGPLAQRPAYDTIGQAVSGIYSLVGEDGAPQLGGIILGDLVTGLSTATGVLAALVGRGASGAGTHLETSILEAMSTITIDAITQSMATGRDPSRRTRHPQAQNFCLATASGEDIAVHCSSSQKFWRGLAAAMDRPELADDPRFATYRDREANYFELEQIVEAEFRTRTSEEWERRLIEHDVPFGEVLTMSGYVTHPQTEWLQITEPSQLDGLALVRPPWRFDGARPARDAVAPLVGAHTRQVAAEVCDADTVEELLASGVLADEDPESAAAPRVSTPY